MKIERGLVHTSAGYLHYRAAGHGPPVVLLHMNQQSSALLLELMTALAPHVRAIAIDFSTSPVLLLMPSTAMKPKLW